MANVRLPDYEAWPWRFWTATPLGGRSKLIEPPRLTELFDADPERVEQSEPRRRLDPFRLVEDAPGRGAARRIRRCWPTLSTIHGARDCLFAGEIVNPTENRPATHVAERGRRQARGQSSSRRAPPAHAQPGRRDRGRRVRRDRFDPAYRHRRVGAGSGPGDRRARPRCRPVRGAGARRTSTARRSTRRPGASIRLRRWSSRSARPSPPPRR